MLQNGLLRILAFLLATIMLLAAVGCNKVYNIADDDMERPWGEKNSGDNKDSSSDQASDRPADSGNDDEEGGSSDIEFEDESDISQTDNTDEGQNGEDSGYGEDNKENEDNKESENSTDGGNNGEAPDFEGESITIILRDSAQASREWYKDTPEDELDEIIAYRNSYVANELNLNVNYAPIPDRGYDAFTAQFNSELINDVASDIHQYDIAATFAYSGAYTEVRDIAANLLDEETFPYFDFNLPCWNRSIVENTAINGRLHYVTGALNLSSTDSAMLIWYNQDLYSEERSEEDPEDLMQYALDGNWTFSDFYRIAAAASSDDDGIYGIDGCAYKTPNPCDLLPIAWEIDLVVENQDGTHSFNIENNSKISNALECYRALISLDLSSGNDTANFTNGQCVFQVGSFYNSAGADMMLREMGDAHSFLPWPKYDEAQAEYHTTSQDYHTLITVLDHSKSSFKTRGDAVSAYLQFSQEYSHIAISPIYKTHRVTKSSNLPDHEKVGKMFDMIVDSITYDFRTIYSPQLNNITWLWRDNMKSADDILNKYLNSVDTYTQAIRGTDTWLGLINTQTE